MCCAKLFRGFLLGLFFVSVITCLPIDVFGQKSSRVVSKQDVLDSQRLFDEAIRVRVLGNVDEAEGKLRELIDRFPFNDAAYYELAKILNESYMYSDARLQMEKAIDLNAGNKWYRILYAQILSSNGEYDAAVRAWRRVVDMEPSNLEYYNELAIAHVEADDFKKAIATYSAAEKKFGVNEEFSIKKYKIWLTMSNVNNAALELKRLIVAFPFQTKYRAQLAELYVANKQDALALEQYKKIAEINPEDEYIHITLSDFYRTHGDKVRSWEELKRGFANPKLSVETKINIVRSYNQNGVTNDEIEKQLDEMIGILAKAHDDNPFVLNLYGATLLDDGKKEEARDAFYRSVAIDSVNYEVWQRLMFIEWELQDVDGTIRTAKRMISLLPSYPVSYLVLGMGLMVEERYEEAIRELKSGIEFVVNDDKLFLQFYMYIGDCYHHLGDDKGTFEYYDMCLKIDSKNAYILNNYAYFLSGVDDRLSEARSMAERAIEYEPESSAAMDTYGWILYKMGDYVEAEKWIRKAIESDKSNSSEVIEHLGDVVYMLGRIDEAVAEWEKAAKADGKKGKLLEQKIKDKKLYE